jgi:transcriptional regulator with XRE-family HTH domain
VSIGQRIKELRKTKNLTQEDLSSMIGITNAAICRIETGENEPSAKVIIALCEKLKVSTDYILLGKESGDSFSNNTQAVIGDNNMTENSFNSNQEQIVAFKETIEAQRKTIEVLERIVEMKGRG